MMACPCCGYEKHEITRGECRKFEKEWAAHYEVNELVAALKKAAPVLRTLSDYGDASAAYETVDRVLSKISGKKANP